MKITFKDNNATYTTTTTRKDEKVLKVPANTFLKAKKTYSVTVSVHGFETDEILTVTKIGIPFNPSIDFMGEKIEGINDEELVYVYFEKKLSEKEKELRRLCREEKLKAAN